MLTYLGAFMCMSVEVLDTGPLSRVLHVSYTLWPVSYRDPAVSTSVVLEIKTHATTLGFL